MISKQERHDEEREWVFTSDMTNHPDLDIAFCISIDILGTQDPLELLAQDRGRDATALIALAVRADHDRGFGQPPVGDKGRRTDGHAERGVVDLLVVDSRVLFLLF